MIRARHFREALRSITRSFGRSLVSMLTVGLTLFLVGVFTAVLLNVSDMAQDAANTLEVKVFIDKAATSEDEETLKKQLQTIEYVTDIRYSTKDEELAPIVAKYKSFELFQNDANPLYNAYVLKVNQSTNIRAVADQARTLPYVAKVNDGGDTSDALVKFASGMRFWGTILIVFLVTIAIILIMNTIRATILSRQTEIEIMRLVGATKWYIRWPFLLEGAITGFLGSLIPCVVLYFGYVFLYNALQHDLQTTHYSLLPADPYALWMTLGLAGVGILIGSFGSLISIRRFLKK